MSLAKIRAALETAINAMSPALATAWENVSFTPTAGTPYQRVSMNWHEPINAEYGRTAMQGGFLQVVLCYPGGAGPAAADARAQLLRSTFYRGASFTADSLTTTIARTPGTLPGFIDDDGRYALAVRIPFFATIPI
jgi:hypothetical protein